MTKSTLPPVGSYWTMPGSGITCEVVERTPEHDRLELPTDQVAVHILHPEPGGSAYTTGALPADAFADLTQVDAP